MATYLIHFMSVKNSNLCRNRQIQTRTQEIVKRRPPALWICQNNGVGLLFGSSDDATSTTLFPDWIRQTLDLALQNLTIRSTKQEDERCNVSYYQPSVLHYIGTRERFVMTISLHLSLMANGGTVRVYQTVFAEVEESFSTEGTVNYL
jgi:hypothetical protein